MILGNLHRGKKPVRDFRKLRLYARAKEDGEPKVKGDTEYAAAFLAAVKKREKE